jgi:hypothetical protein
MIEHDHSKRTSYMYDDRDGDVVTSLDQKIIKTCDEKTPKMVFFLVPRVPETEEAMIDLHVEGYARMADLSKETATLVRSELGLLEKKQP